MRCFRPSGFRFVLAYSSCSLAFPLQSLPGAGGWRRTRSPAQHLPAVLKCDATQTGIGINRKRVSDRCQHPDIQHLIAVREAVGTRNAARIREVLGCRRFCFAEHRCTVDAAGPESVAYDEAGRDDGNRRFDSTPEQLTL